MRRDFRASRSLYESQSRSMWQFRPGAGGVLMKALRHIMTYIRRNTHIYIILCIYVNKIIPLSLSLSLSRSFYWSIDLLIHWTIDLLIYWSIYLSIYLSIHPNSLVQICTHSLYNEEIIFDLDHFDCWRKCCEHIISSTHLRSTSLQSSQMRKSAWNKSGICWQTWSPLGMILHFSMYCGIVSSNSAEMRPMAPPNLLQATNSIVFSWHSSTCINVSMFGTLQPT